MYEMSQRHPVWVAENHVNPCNSVYSGRIPGRKKYFFIVLSGASGAYRWHLWEPAGLIPGTCILFALGVVHGGGGGGVRPPPPVLGQGGPIA